MEITKPIIEFKNNKQAYKCLKEWQSRLFLDDWIIKVTLCSDKDFDDENGFKYVGQNEQVRSIKASSIRILKYKYWNKNSITKYCAEKTLVHELLHCKYNWLEFDYRENIPVVYYDTEEHQLLEQMAKSLIMAKYNLPFEWFKNF